jgi:glycine betaine catabolism B
MLRLKSVHFETQQFQNHNLKPHQINDEWQIGRSPNCDVVLHSLEVSRIHGRVSYADDAYYFVDASSTSGSLLNGEVLKAETPYVLHVGDLLQLGETFLYVEEVESVTTNSNVPTHGFPLHETWTQQASWDATELWCRCDRIVQETPDMKTFCFVAEQPMLFHYLPGQFVTLGLEIEGKSVMRPYSISSSPSRPHHLSVTIKRVPGGLVSNWMHDHFNVGDRLKLVGGPMGHFTCLPNLPRKMLLISAGSGITPMLSMSRCTQDTLMPTDIVFLHSARQVADLAFRSELESMAQQMPNFRLLTTLTQATQDPWMGLMGRISAPMLELTVPDLMERSVFVCGPNAFMQHVRETLEDMGFPMAQYTEESFGGAPAAPQAKQITAGKNTVEVARSMPQSSVVAKPVTAAAPSPSQGGAVATAVAVTFQTSNQTIESDGSETILELAEQAGVALRSACRMGACGACKVRTTKGDVSYTNPPSALSASDQADGLILACVAYPAGCVAIEA